MNNESNHKKCTPSCTHCMYYKELGDDHAPYCGLKNRVVWCGMAEHCKYYKEKET